MSGNRMNDAMFGMYVAETTEMIEKLETIALESESTGVGEAVGEIFRIMHTVKGSSAMMEVHNVSQLTHTFENLFQYIRENLDIELDNSLICDLMLQTVDFIKEELEKMQNGGEPDADNSALRSEIENYLNQISGKQAKASEKKAQTQQETNNEELKQNYMATIRFEDGCGMENIRAFQLVNTIKAQVKNLTYQPENIVADADTAQIIIDNGFVINFYSDELIQPIRELLNGCLSVKEAVVVKNPKRDAEKEQEVLKTENENTSNQPQDKQINNIMKQAVVKQSRISVDAEKLDQLMDLMEELVISETMVLKNPEFSAINSQRLQKEANQLEKITNELRDVVMAIRMVPLTATFQKMTRLVRDMGKKLDKKVVLKTSGENVEADKNIIDKIADPLLHIIRNSVDHGIETQEDRAKTDKDEMGTVWLSAENLGSDVIITIKDDGKGLNREAILEKAREKGIIEKPESELTDQEIYEFIFHPGFSTKKQVTEFSGRGVGMDVVNKNIKSLNGSISVDSTLGKGTTMTIKIPMTIAIIDGMLIKVGDLTYTIPTMSIKECFKTTDKDVLKDRYGNESVIMRDQCYPFIRLHNVFGEENKIETLEEAIVVMVQYEGKDVCLLADALIGRQQVVVKGLPKYIMNTKNISGCTLLGDGSVSLIIDIPSFMK